MKYLSIVLIILMAGCSQNNADTQKEIASLKADVYLLKSSIEELKSESIVTTEMTKQLSHTGAIFNPTDTTFRTISTKYGILLISIENIQPYANGSKITVSIGNPLSMQFSNCKFKAAWSSIDGGDTLRKSVDRVGDLISGRWNPDTLILDGVTPDKLKSIAIGDVTCNTVNLR